MYLPSQYNSHFSYTSPRYFSRVEYSNANYVGSSIQSYSPSTQYVSKEADLPHSSIIVEEFLAKDRPETPVINTLGEIKNVIDEAFKFITSHDFPHDAIKVTILPKAGFKDVFLRTGGAWSEGIMGFSLNRFGKGVSEIVVKEEHLDSLLLTIGHEIGHVLSPSLPSIQDEEAKAHAFSLAWMETIRDNNIAGLKPNILINPAKNGIHDVGFEFVQHLMCSGSSALDVFRTLSRGLASIIAREA